MFYKHVQSLIAVLTKARVGYLTFYTDSCLLSGSLPGQDLLLTPSSKLAFTETLAKNLSAECHFLITRASSLLGQPGFVPDLK